MRRYELTYIIHPDIIGDEMNAVMEQVESWIKAGEGTVQKVSDWGRRRMAYPIENQREGHYIHLEADLNPVGIRNLERSLILNEQIIRYLLIRAEN